MADFEKEKEKRAERWRAAYGLEERWIRGGGLESHVDAETCEAFWGKMLDAELDELGKGIGDYNADYLCAYITLRCGSQTKGTMKAFMELSNDEVHKLSGVLENVGDAAAKSFLEMLTNDTLYGRALGFPEFPVDEKVRMIRKVIEPEKVPGLVKTVMNLAAEMPTAATLEFIELAENGENAGTLVAMAAEMKAEGISGLLGIIRDRAKGSHEDTIGYGKEFLKNYRLAEKAGAAYEYMELYKEVSHKYPSLVARRLDDLMEAEATKPHDVKPVLHFITVLDGMDKRKAERAVSLCSTKGGGISRETLDLLGEIERRYAGGMAAFLNDYAEAVRNGEGKDFVRKFEEEKPAGGGVGSGGGAGSDGCHVWVPKPNKNQNGWDDRCHER